MNSWFGFVEAACIGGDPFAVSPIGHVVESGDVERGPDLRVLIDEAVQAHPADAGVVDVCDLGRVGGVVVEDRETAIA